MQFSENENEIINKIYHYILDFYFDINDEEEDVENNKNTLIDECSDVINSEKKEIYSDNNESNGLYFNEFFPRIIPKNQKKRKEFILKLKMKKIISKNFGGY